MISFLELPAHGGRVVRFKRRRDIDWLYTKITPYPGGYCPYSSGQHLNCLGVPAEGEMTTPGVHQARPILDHYYEDPEFVIELVAERDAAGRKFSYSGGTA